MNTDAQVIDYHDQPDQKELDGSINTSDEGLIANISHSIRLGHQQIKPQQIQPERVCIVGGGPSLSATLPELRDLYFAGAKIVTVNGSYRWCIEHNLHPSAQVVLDARASNAKFIEPAIPRCRYLIASQCHPDTWKAVEGRDVWIWHAASDESPQAAVLNEYYFEKWVPMVGGTTVVMRAIMLMRVLGFLRMDLFGVDSCYLDNNHHAYEQPENDRDGHVKVTAYPSGHPELKRVFDCAPWHVKQLECFLQTIRFNGHNFVLNVHGEGLLAYALQSGAQIEMG